MKFISFIQSKLIRQTCFIGSLMNEFLRQDEFIKTAQDHFRKENKKVSEELQSIIYTYIYTSLIRNHRKKGENIFHREGYLNIFTQVSEFHCGEAYVFQSKSKIHVTLQFLEIQQAHLWYTYNIIDLRRGMKARIVPLHNEGQHSWFIVIFVNKVCPEHNLAILENCDGFWNTQSTLACHISNLYIEVLNHLSN